MESDQTIDIDALKAQIDAEIAARMLIEADSARYIQRRGFRIGNYKLLVQPDAASEVLELPPLFRLPGAPAGVTGLANRHGRVVPVVDLSAVFGIQIDSAPRYWLLVYGRSDEAVGLVIDVLPERKRFVREDEVPLSDMTLPIASYAKAAYREGEDVWIDLDAEALFENVFNVDSSQD